MLPCTNGVDPWPHAREIWRATRRARNPYRFLLYLAFAGPGLIAASAGNDAGGVVTYASAGAQFGYRTLFFMVIVTVFYVVIQEMVARLSVYTGKGLGGGGDHG